MFFHARVIQELGLSATSQLPSLVLCQFFPQSEQQLRISTTGILDAILIEKKTVLKFISESHSMEIRKRTDHV